MSRLTTRCAVLIVLAATVLHSGYSAAEDGDVAYSSPYITVDPDTGELITVNPGPELRSHQKPVAPDVSSRVSNPSQQLENGPSPLAIVFYTALAGGLGGSVAILLMRVKQRAKRPNVTKS